MLRFVDLEDDQGPDETLLAGIKPLPINRMIQQAGRLKNRSPSGRSAGPMMFSRKDRTRLNLDKDEVETLRRSDPQFAASYERQIIEGKDPKMTDKYSLHKGANGGVTGSQFSPYKAGGEIQRERMDREQLNQLTIQRQQQTRETIDNWDPIEASAQEDYNRMKGKMGPADAVELIQPIAPLDGEYKQSGSFPGV